MVCNDEQEVCNDSEVCNVTSLLVDNQSWPWVNINHHFWGVLTNNNREWLYNDRATGYTLVLDGKFTRKSITAMFLWVKPL